MIYIILSMIIVYNESKNSRLVENVVCAIQTSLLRSVLPSRKSDYVYPHRH